jgi:hypothetical protein
LTRRAKQFLIFHSISGNKITTKIIILVFEIQKNPHFNEGFYFLSKSDTKNKATNTPADARNGIFVPGVIYRSHASIGPTICQILWMDELYPITLPISRPALRARSEPTAGLNEPIPRGKNITQKKSQYGLSLREKPKKPIISIKNENLSIWYSSRYLRIYFTSHA